MVEKEKDQEKEKEEKEKDQEKEKEEKEKDQEEVEKDVTEENAIVQEEEETHYEEVLPDDSFSYAATLTEELGNPIVQDLLQLKMNTEEGILEFDMSKEDDIKIGHYVAVAYESEWFAGLVTEKLNDTFKINFLKKISTGNDYKWPSKEDTSCHDLTSISLEISTQVKYYNFYSEMYFNVYVHAVVVQVLQGSMSTKVKYYNFYSEMYFNVYVHAVVVQVLQGSMSTQVKCYNFYSEMYFNVYVHAVVVQVLQGSMSTQVKC
ncbi:unnamed protein product [Mytilus edulis]|uniref:Uncharacterized protein n=1 Tax=Mytilus edulis TaxID=6550 RepID=A0A8S3UH85_MYTED|nr:unnamed protein product [Mytilus edulis]